ncbi:MAG: PBS lyase [Desulfobacterium sp.]|nr:PBS lyase [Desulfobacterium sp.]
MLLGKDHDLAAVWTDDNHMRFRKLKIQIQELLEKDEFPAALEEICNLPSIQVVNPLFSFFHAGNELLKWRAITAMGRVVSMMAARNPESARVVMRRLIWNLNDESGGIGWGSPEAMGEIMAQNKDMAGEYHHLLLSFIMPHGNFIEHAILQRGVLWGIGQFAHAEPALVQSSIDYLIPFMTAQDPFLRGLASWTSALYNYEPTNRLLIQNKQDHSLIVIYQNSQLKEVTVSFMASQNNSG